MSGPFHIRRIQLVNFHNFVDEILAVRKNLFLIGDNQSGKTTVLDAVHFAVSAGVEMEFNAAARFGPRAEPGRTLASIVLRYDLERDLAQRGPSVAYAALEIADAAGPTHVFGAGAFATSLDAQPDVWGFVARDRTLDEVGLCAEEPDGAGGTRRRPRDRQGLEERLGRGAVLDKGRYRSAVAQLLFRDRDAYTRALELIAAGKAYREMVARARNLDDLFVGLLPPPAESEFEEIRSALRAIEGIRSDLADLEGELEILRRVIEKLREAIRETEKIARYEFVGVELTRRRAAEEFDEARRRAEAAAADAAAAEAAKTAAAADGRACETALRGLRASEGAALLAREGEARSDAAEAATELARAGADQVVREDELRRALDEAGRATANLEAAKDDAARALRSIVDVARGHLDADSVVAVGALAEAVTALEPDSGVSLGTLDKPLAVVRAGFGAAREAAAGRAALAEGEADRLRAEAEGMVAAADAVRRRAELLPDLPGYDVLLLDLEAHASRAVPLYRLFAIGPPLAAAAGAGIECVLGARVLGAIVVPPDQHPAARARVIAQGGGVEVVDPSEVLSDAPGPRPGTLPAALVDAGPSELAPIARAYLERVAGDVRLLEAGESRGDAERAVWTDGHIYEQGAESRVDIAGPRFLGAEARAQAAADEAARLERHAERLRAAGRRAEEAAAALREVARSCRDSLDGLRACEPAPFLAFVAAAETARARIEERRAALAEAESRLERARARVAILERRHSELADAVRKAGVSDLRDRIARTEQELEHAREEEKTAIDRAGRARSEGEERRRAQQAAADVLRTASEHVRARREALLPLVEPRYRGELEEYVFRTMRGQQILPENVAGLVQEASNARARAFEWLTSSDGLRHQRLWQKYAFRLNEATREIHDQSGRPVEQVYEDRDREVHALRTALDERTRDLLERAVMAGLVRRLQGQVRELRETIQGINRLAADLRFGTSRFQFSLRQRPEFQRLLDLLREQSVLQPTLREELRDFFQARLDDLRQAREGEVPEILDYRRWFEYLLQVQSRGDGAAQDLSRQRLRFGSTGEQAVPTYLLVLAVASLLYDRTDARLRLLLLDEAFLGIDAGRREVLLQFADRAAVDLIVATPELDGVTPALAASSTLFIEKTPEQDVFVSDYHWERPGPQPGLFDRPDGTREADLVLGRRGPEPPAPPAADDRLGVREGDVPTPAPP